MASELMRIRFTKAGGHVHCRVFYGPADGTLALTGTLVFRQEEFANVQRLLCTLSSEQMRMEWISDA